MNTRHNLASLVSAANWSQPLNTFSSNLVSRAQNALSVLGLAAIAALALMFFRPELTDQLKAISPFSEDYTASSDDRDMVFSSMMELPEHTSAPSNHLYTGAVLQPVAMKNELASGKEQQLVTSWLARRYRIASSASKMLVEAAYSSAHEVKLDPLLVLSVMAIESRFNPFAESSVGAQGLMQVMAKVHYSKFNDHGGTKSVLNPIANIQVGAQILKEAIRRSGSVEAGLKLYVGAGNMETDGGYASKVMAEYSKLQAVASGKRVPAFTPPATLQATDGLREAKVTDDKPSTRSHAEEPV